MYKSGISLSALLLIFLCAQLAAQDLIVYPANGQNAQQTEKDKFECYNWAKQQSGFDPMQAAQASSPPPQTGSSGPGVVGGAAGGAALGAVGGAIAGNAGTGAAIGAATGALFGGMRKRSHERQRAEQQQAHANQQAAQQSGQRNTFNRAYKACMEGRGYTVN